MKSFYSISFAIVLSLLFAALAAGQGLDPSQFAGAQKQNAEALKKYSHKERVDLQLKGESKKVTLNLVRTDAYGNEQKTLLSEQPEKKQESEPSQGPRRGGRLKEKMIESKKEEFQDMMQGLIALVKSYTNVPPDQMKAAMARAEKAPGQGELQGAIGLKLTNVVQDKDAMTLWIVPSTMLFKRIEIASAYEQKPVTVQVQYATLPSGPSYMSLAEVNYPEKSLLLRVENFDYETNQ